MVLLLPACTQTSKALVDYVDPNIGTAHCRWFFYTPAAVPFGMAKLAPSTDAHLGNPGGWQAVGYDFVIPPLRVLPIFTSFRWVVLCLHQQ